MSTHINTTLSQAAHAYIKANALVSIGDIVNTTWGDWKRPQRVRISHVGAHLVCRYDDALKDWVAGFAMEYNAERLRKDGTSKERNEGGGICLRNLMTLDGKTKWSVAGRWEEDLGFNHAGLSWGTSRDTRINKKGAAS